MAHSFDSVARRRLQPRGGDPNYLSKFASGTLALILLPLLSSPLKGAEPDAPASQPEPSLDSDMLTPGRTTLELSAMYFVEPWNFNGRLKPDRLAGGSAAASFTIHDGLGTVVEVLGMRVAQQLRDVDLVRPPAAYVGGVSGCFGSELQSTAAQAAHGLHRQFAPVPPLERRPRRPSSQSRYRSLRRACRCPRRPLKAPR
jgi:hypothetical protein